MTPSAQLLKIEGTYDLRKQNWHTTPGDLAATQKAQRACWCANHMESVVSVIAMPVTMALRMLLHSLR